MLLPKFVYNEDQSSGQRWDGKDAEYPTTGRNAKNLERRPRNIEGLSVKLIAAKDCDLAILRVCIQNLAQF